MASGLKARLRPGMWLSSRALSKATLSFLSLFLFENARKTAKKQTKIFIPTEPLKSLKRRRENAKKSNSSKEKKGIPKEQGKEVQGIEAKIMTLHNFLGGGS